MTAPRASEPRPGPSRAEQGACRDFDSLVALYERYGAAPHAARCRAQHVMEARQRRREAGKPFRRVYRARRG